MSFSSFEEMEWDEDMIDFLRAIGCFGDYRGELTPLERRIIARGLRQVLGCRPAEPRDHDTGLIRRKPARDLFPEPEVGDIGEAFREIDRAKARMSPAFRTMVEVQPLLAPAIVFNEPVGDAYPDEERVLLWACSPDGPEDLFAEWEQSRREAEDDE